MATVSGIVVVNENPPFVNGLANLYKYEPFSYQYTPASGTFFSNLVTNPEILSFTTNTSSSISFQSISGYQVSYNNAFPFAFDLYSVSAVYLGTYSNNFRVNAGRFFPPVFGASNTFYLNEAITPISFNTSAAMSSVFANPAMIPGLTFSNVGGVGTQWRLQGTPIAQTPTTAYQIIGTSGGRVATTSNTYTVLPERLRLFVNNSLTSSNVPLSIAGMQIGTTISSNVITAAFPGAPSFLYQWNAALPDGLEFTDSSGTVIPSTLFSFAPTDASRTIILRGTPSLTAAKNFIASNISNYTVTLGGFQARPSGTLSNTLPIQFSFGETVLFTADPYSNQLYLNISFNAANNISFRAATYFSSGQSITSITSPNLRSDLSINFNVGTQTAYLVSSNGPTYVSTDTFTLRARNTTAKTRDASLTIQAVNDFLTWNGSTPAQNTSYSFIFSKPLSNAKTGYYPYPIQFNAVSAAGQSVVYSVTGFQNTNIGLTSNILSGVPFLTSSLTTATITALAPVTGASIQRSIQYEILDDVINLSSTPALPYVFRQNIPMTPVTLKSTTLSGRAVASYSGNGFPTGVTISPTGKIVGTPTSSVSGTYTITATTGLKLQSFTYPFLMSRDTVLFMIDSNVVLVPAGSNVPAGLQYMIESFSGNTVSNVQILPGNPTQFGVVMNSLGEFSGTVSTNIPPNAVIPQYPQRVPFNVSASVGDAYGTTVFYISALNANGPRRLFASGTPVSNIGIYYSIPTNLSNSPQSVVDLNYSNWISNTSITAGYRVTDMGIRYISSTSSTILVCMNNGSDGRIFRSTDSGKTFTQTFSNAIQVQSLTHMSNDYWMAAAAFGLSNVRVNFSSNDGVSWSSFVIPQGTGIGGGGDLQARVANTVGYPRVSITKFLNTSSTVVLTAGQGYLSNAAETIMYASNNYSTGTWTFTASSTYIKKEASGVLIPNSNERLYYGSDYYLTNNPPATFVPSPTMVGTASGDSFPIPGDFNYFCYDVKRYASNLYVATGVHNYGSGYVPEVRVSSNIFGVYGVTNLSSGTLFSPTATPPVPNIGYGPSFSDASYIYMPVTQGSNAYIYKHLIQAPPLTNWISTSSSLGNINITATVDTSLFIVDPSCTAVIEFGTSTPSSRPTFTSPTQTDYLFYQYLTIDPIQVTAQAAPNGGEIFLIANDVPQGFSFNGTTGVLTGTPTQLGQQAIQIHAFDVSWNSFTTLNLNFNTIIPRFIHKQVGAGAYTSLLRNYVEVNAAQNSRDIRVLPTEERKQGAFAAPDGADVITQVVDPKCFDPKACN